MYKYLYLYIRCVCMYVHTYWGMCIYALRVCIHVPMCPYIFLCMSVCVCMHVHVWCMCLYVVHVCVYVMHLSVCVSKHVCECIHTLCLCICSPMCAGIHVRSLYNDMCVYICVCTCICVMCMCMGEEEDGHLKRGAVSLWVFGRMLFSELLSLGVAVNQSPLRGRNEATEPVQAEQDSWPSESLEDRLVPTLPCLLQSQLREQRLWQKMTVGCKPRLFRGLY